MAYSTDFGGNGTTHLKAARNEHKTARAVNKQKVTAGRASTRASAPEKQGKPGRAAKRPIAAPLPPEGVHVERRFSTVGVDPLDEVVYERRSSTITNPDGSVVFKMDGAEVPASWSQLATDILISKYFRKAGLHGDKDRGETSVRQVVHRLAHTIRRAADDFGSYFATKADADAFEAELSYLLVQPVRRVQLAGLVQLRPLARVRDRGLGRQLGLGLRRRTTSRRPTNAYERPQCSACFIQAVNDDLMSHLRPREDRGAPLQVRVGHRLELQRHPRQAGEALGRRHVVRPHEFLEVFDRAAGATKSGGTTRRAAKMVCLDMDHPEIVDFINWKVREEKKAHALIAAGYSLRLQRRGVPHHQRPELEQLRPRHRRVHARGRSPAASGRHASARPARSATRTRPRTSGARSPRRRGAAPTRACSTTRQSTAGTRARTTGRINALEPVLRVHVPRRHGLQPLERQPHQVPRARTARFDVDGYRHACRVFFIAQEILVDLSSYPTAHIAKNSHDYRPLGLGYANLGSLLMSARRPVRQPRGARDGGGAHGHHVRARVQDERGDGRVEIAFRRLTGT